MTMVAALIHDADMSSIGLTFMLPSGLRPTTHKTHHTHAKLVTMTLPCSTPNRGDRLDSAMSSMDNSRVLVIRPRTASSLQA